MITALFIYTGGFSLVEVIVYHGDIEQGIRTLKKKLQREGKPRQMKITHHEKPSEKRARKKMIVREEEKNYTKYLTSLCSQNFKSALDTFK